VQRVSQAHVEIKRLNYFKEIEKGMVILLGVKKGDTDEDVFFVADKCCNLRIFEDENNKMNLSIKEIKGEILIISQFTLYGNARKGNRPSFDDAAKPEEANKLYEKFIDRLKINLGEDKIKTGIFAEMMEVKILNNGPVTILVESKE